MSKVNIKGAKKGLSESELEQVIKKVFLEAADDLSWLKPGESVLLKPAINSFDPYPSTTHPLALKVVSQVLQEKGAKVIVGDQSGIEHVVQDENGVVRGSSRECFEKAQTPEQTVCVEQCPPEQCLEGSDNSEKTESPEQCLEGSDNSEKTESPEQCLEGSDNSEKTESPEQCSGHTAREGSSGHTDFKAFEKEDWNSGFYKFESEKTKSWPNGFYVTDWINRVDHVINLPRLSTHAQAGVTLGFKNMVGVLRLDSRMDFHANGPLNNFAVLNAKGSKLVSRNDGLNKFFEKIVEISLALQKKLRLTLVVGTEAQVTLGPDKYALSFFGRRMLKSHHVIPETGFVFASSDQVTAEIIGIALLTMWHKKASVSAKFWQIVLASMNRQADPLGTYNPWESPFVKHAIEVGLGESNVEVSYEDVSEKLQSEISGLLKRETTRNFK